MLAVIDNYDSFVNMLCDYLRQLGANIKLFRSDKFDVDELVESACVGQIDAIVISPGPKTPYEARNCIELVTKIQNVNLQICNIGSANSEPKLNFCTRQIPILGVCLGHQIIAVANGAHVKRGSAPMHGKVTPITHAGSGLFAGLPSNFLVTRYHSLVVEFVPPTSKLLVDAWSEDGAIMAIRRNDMPVFGVQFHPEAVMTEYGLALLNNFLNICKEVSYEHSPA